MALKKQLQALQYVDEPALAALQELQKDERRALYQELMHLDA